jgi:NTP pyrophosphatase (non-canonical NTP hydrolase)
MSLQDYQRQIDDMLQDYEKPYWHPLSNLARLLEEAGEVSRILNHHFGDKPKKETEVHEDLGEELADIIYSVICLANSQGIQLDKPMQKVIGKLETRDKGRFAKKKPRTNPL